MTRVLLPFNRASLLLAEFTGGGSNAHGLSMAVWSSH